MAGKLRVTLIKSPISHTSATRGTVRALGLHRLGETVEVTDNPQTRGMARAIRFLVRTEEIGATEASAPVATDESTAVATDESTPVATDEATEDRHAPARRKRPSTRKEESTA
jgi:large subunit ribosomal protein L30